MQKIDLFLLSKVIRALKIVTEANTIWVILFANNFIFLMMAATENGYQREKEDEVIKENVELTVENAQSQEAPHPTEEAPEAVNDEQPSTDNEQKEDTQEPSIENPQLENPQQPTGEEFEKPAEEIPQQEVGDVPSAEVQQQPTSETQTMSRKMEVPNNKVGLLSC